MKKVIIILAIFGLSGCAGLSYQEQGAITGAVVGGVVGNHIGGGTGRALMTGLGVVIGAAIGKENGRMLDQRYQPYDENRDPKYMYNEGELAAYRRGQIARQEEIQRQREINAYRRGRAGY